LRNIDQSRVPCGADPLPIISDASTRAGTADTIHTCPAMKILAGLLTYTAVVCLLAGGVVQGTRWLAEPDPAIKRETRAAPIPPRIAESIERKKPLPVPAVTAAPEPVKPVMQEASASLTNQPAVKIRELSPPPQRSVKKRHEQKQKPVVAEAPAAAPAQGVSTARTDFPY
jgi:hypothetical protein